MWTNSITERMWSQILTFTMLIFTSGSCHHRHTYSTNCIDSVINEPWWLPRNGYNQTYATHSTCLLQISYSTHSEEMLRSSSMFFIRKSTFHSSNFFCSFRMNSSWTNSTLWLTYVKSAYMTLPLIRLLTKFVKNVSISSIKRQQKRKDEEKSLHVTVDVFHCFFYSCFYSLTFFK